MRYVPKRVIFYYHLVKPVTSSNPPPPSRIYNVTLLAGRHSDSGRPQPTMDGRRRLGRSCLDGGGRVDGANGAGGAPVVVTTVNPYGDGLNAASTARWLATIAGGTSHDVSTSWVPFGPSPR